MLINLSNHPSVKWDNNQLLAAEQSFGKPVVDIPFPAISPSASLDEVKKIATQYINICLSHLKTDEMNVRRHAIHVMGEFTFVVQFVKEMEPYGIPCVASTSERIVDEKIVGATKEKTVIFRFTQFRPYYNTLHSLRRVHT